MNLLRARSSKGNPPQLVFSRMCTRGSCSCYHSFIAMTALETLKLSRREGQEGPIKKAIKAEAMANTEDEYQVEASTYQKYLDNPHEFDEELALEKRYWDAVTQEGFCLLPEGDPAIKFADRTILRPSRLQAYVKEGITPEDLRTIGDRTAEVRGLTFDFEENIRSVPTARLLADYPLIKAVQLKHALPTPTNERELRAGMELTTKKHETNLNRLEAYLKRNAMEKELIARSFDSEGKKENAEIIRQTDVSEWKPIRWSQHIFDGVVALARAIGIN